MLRLYFLTSRHRDYEYARLLLVVTLGSFRTVQDYNGEEDSYTINRSNKFIINSIKFLTNIFLLTLIKFTIMASQTSTKIKFNMAYGLGASVVNYLVAFIQILHWS